MTALSSLVAREVAEAYDFADVSSVVDVAHNVAAALESRGAHRARGHHIVTLTHREDVAANHAGIGHPAKCDQSYNGGIQTSPDARR